MTDLRQTPGESDEPPTTILWTIAAWRCELYGRRWVRLLKDGKPVSEQLVSTEGAHEDWVGIWRAAIVDVEHRSTEQQ
jgi:hypothetical protein